MKEQIYTYDELPELAKRSVHVFPYLDEENYRKVKFRLYQLPMETATEKCMSYDEMKQNYTNFEDYHKKYCSFGDVPHHKEQYPVFHDPTEEYEWLIDGWHRFHSYYRSGFTEIPVIEVLL